MNLRLIFIISALLQLSTWLIVMQFDYAENYRLFYIAEVMTAVNIAYIIFFYRKVHRPIQALTDGIDLLKAQDWNTTLQKVGQPEVDKIATTFNTMIERLREQRLRFEEQSHFLNLLIARAPIGVIIINFNRLITIVNPAAERIFGLSAPEMTGMTVKDLPGSVGECIASLSVSDSRIIRTENGATYKCSCYSLIDRGVAHRFFLIEDVGDAMADAERAAYERIIRVIAHEVNNTVAPIATSLDIVSDILDPSTDTSALLRSCSERALGMSAFVSRLAEVVKIPEPAMKPCNINDVILRNRPFLESLCMPSGCSVAFNLDDNAPMCMADVSLIEQTLVNIVKNAAESIALTSRTGEVSIATSRSPKDALIVTITDNGAGISPEKSVRIFTPFYTDKPGGQGVGLTFVREVLRRHKCSYSLRTDSDGLTRFTIEFPIPSRG